MLAWLRSGSVFCWDYTREAMKRYPILAILLAAQCLFAAERPNIIFILTDDLGWGDVGVFFQNGRKNAGDRSEPWHLTPNLDQMAAEGAQLPNHYCAAPVCAPSRASIMLGVSQGHANIRDNQFDKALEDNHTVANVLRRSGYATVAIGKWGLQGNGKEEVDPATWTAYPTKRGFDNYFGYVRHRDGHEHYPKEGLYRGSKEVWDGDKNIADVLDKCYTADLWTAKAKHWIVEHHKAKASQPFYMYLAYDTPHAVDELPTQAYPAGGGLKGGLQWLGQPGHMINTASGTIDSWIHPSYRGATYDHDKNPTTPEVAWPNVYQRYATSVRRIDDAVGDIKQLLQDLKIDRDTLMVFSSDNGPSIESYLPKQNLEADFFKSFGPFDGIKRDVLEGGVRVATLARWPGHIPAGKVMARPSISYDWLPTFADAAGVPVPARIDGISLLPDLTGKGTPAKRDYLYVEYFNPGKSPTYSDFTPANRGRKRGQMQAVRMGDFVGIRYDIKSATAPFEIYNVVNDPKETKDLAPKMEELEAKMRAVVLQARRPDSSAPRPYDDEFVPAVAVKQVINGVEWKSYEGAFQWVPNLETLKAKASGTASQIDLSKRTRDNELGMLFTGYLKVPEDGGYTFSIETDTGALLRIHDATVIDADYGYVSGKEASGSIKLKAGLHPFRLYYSRGKQGKPALKFSWITPGAEKQSIPAGNFYHAK